MTRFLLHTKTLRHIRDDLVGCFILLHYIVFDDRFLALFLTFDLCLGLQGTWCWRATMIVLKLLH
jgi:hypothetical protein